MFQNILRPDFIGERYESALTTASVLLNALALVSLAIITFSSHA